MTLKIKTACTKKLTAYWAQGKPATIWSTNFCLQYGMRDFDKVEDIGAHERGIFGGQENYCIMWIASLSKLYFGNQIKEDKMVLACGIYW